MQPLGDAREHFFRTLAMARHQKVDLTVALAEGSLTRTAYADLVTSCRRCPDPVECDRLLADGREVAFCPNADLFARLAGA